MGRCNLKRRLFHTHPSARPYVLLQDSQATHTASSMSCESDCFSDSHRRSGDHSPQSLRHEGMLTTNMEGILDDGQPHTPLHRDGDPATPGLEVRTVAARVIVPGSRDDSLPFV